jgi:hypothetical protein
MSGKLEVVVSNPEKRIFETPSRQLILVGRWGETLPDAGRFMGLPRDEAIRLLAGQEVDGCCVVTEKDAWGNPAEILAYRGPASGCELYYAQAGEGAFFVSDSFRDAVEVFPPSQRKLSAEGFLDFLLFQYSVFPETPVDPIRRLGHGELLRAGRDGDVSLEIMGRLDASGSVKDYEDGVDRIEEALCGAMGRTPEGTMNLLSGGVDSTLVQVLLGSGHGAVAAAVDSPEFAFETENAKQSASLCGVNLEQRLARESEFLDLLEKETRLGKIPLPLPQVALIASVFDVESPSFVSGFDADSLFSLPRSKRKLVLEGVDPGSFEEEGFSVSPERGLIEDLFGKERVADRIAERKEAVRSRVVNPQGLSRLALGCLTSFFCSSFPAYRQLALARKKSFSTPYMDRQVVEAALGVPLPDRVVRNRVFKPVLKEILARRLPGFPREQEKGGSGLPRTRLCTEGPLKDYFRGNALPAHIDPEKAGPILDPGWESSMTAFRCIAWSVWEKAIREIGNGEKDARHG